MTGNLLAELVAAYGVAVVSVLLLNRLKVPPLVGFMLAGVVVGPHGLKVVTDPDAVRWLADVGVVILLFTIGVEMSISRLVRMGGWLPLVGLGQMALATGAAALLALALSPSLPGAVTLGILVAASSTTIVLRCLGERGELDAPHGRLSVGVCLVQDLAVVPVMVLLPLLAGGAAAGNGLLAALAKAVGVLFATFVLARWVVPWVFERVVATRSRELFALAVIFLCLGTALLAQEAGLSLALGAFLGGLVVAESPYSQQVLGEMLPIRDGLSGLFFVGVGMLLDVGFAVSHPLLLAAAVLGILLVKTLTTGTAVLFAGYGLRVAALVGVALAQVGEFSFVVLREAQGPWGLLDAPTAQLFLASAVLTMAATPFLYRAAPALADALDRLSRRRPSREVEGLPEEAGAQAHVVVVGYGLTGRHVGIALSGHGHPFVVIEMNPETVRRERAAGTAIFYGDAGHAEVLERAGIDKARVLVVAVNDVASARRIVATAKRVAPGVRAIVRARYLKEVAELTALGADEVVPDELETSVEIFARVLRAYGLSSEAIERSAAAIREDAQPSARPTGARGGLGADEARRVAHVDLETHVVGPGAPADGRTIGDLAVRKRFGVTIVAVRRGDQVLSVPDAATDLHAADVVVVLGTPERLAAAAPLFRRPDDAPAVVAEGGEPAAESEAT